MTELLVTHEMLKNIKTDADFYKSITSSHLLCEDVMAYDYLMDLCCKLQVDAWGKREKLIIDIP